MCWALLSAQTEPRKHRNLCPEAEKLTTGTELLIEGKGGGCGERTHLCLSAPPWALRGAETAHVSLQPRILELFLIVMASQLFRVISHLGTAIKPSAGSPGPARSLGSPCPPPGDLDGPRFPTVSLLSPVPPHQPAPSSSVQVQALPGCLVAELSLSPWMLWPPEVCGSRIPPTDIRGGKCLALPGT